ncbi:hypothetical protein M271_11990 [Streptomyces rapamycinicus NRRL 5491]|nr:hypothetical protein M271_11990 [Streptomyces rapamycinicus NRRL 5491]
MAVVERVECRRVLETTVSGVPAVMDRVAARCRRSCRVMRGDACFLGVSAEAVQDGLRSQ